MNIIIKLIRKAGRLIVALWAGCFATTDSPGTPERPVDKLEDLLHALRLIKCLTHDDILWPAGTRWRVNKIHQTAFDALGEAQK